VKILMVASSLPPDRWSGAGRALRDLWGQARRHHEVRLVTGWWRDRAALPPDLTAVAMTGPAGPRSQAALAAAVWSEARRFRPELVLSGSVVLPPLSAPVVLATHDLRLPRGGAAAALRARAFGALARRARAVVTTSVGSAADLTALGLPSSLVRVVPGAVDLDHFHPVGRAADPARPLSVLCAGRVMPAKGQHLAIDAVARLDRERKGRVRLTIAGAVVDPVYLDQLRVQAWGQPVDFVLDPPLLAPHLQAADIVLLPSIAESGFCTTAVEAMACGAPVIWSDRPATREAVGGVGQAFPPGDVDALRAALRRWIDAPDERAAAARLGHAHAVGNNGWDSVWPRWEEVLAAAAR
jgi:glycosyltransferase involved in cell wall biosynthesis